MSIISSIILIVLLFNHHQNLASGQSIKFSDDNHHFNQRPVIGILTMPIEDSGNRTSPSNFPSSYVKFIESAGGRVIPVLVGKDEDYYAKMINITSGMLLTGGSIDLTDSVYTQSAYLIWKITLKINDNDQYYPLLGICQGFEFFLYAANGLAEWPLIKCEAENLVERLTFMVNETQIKQSKMFQWASDQIIKTLSNKRVTYNAHSWCLPVSPVSGQFFPRIGDFFRTLAKSIDSNGIEFISLIESVDYPIYGLQFHPEKPAFEPVISPDRSNTPHSLDAVLIGQFFANLFISEARKSVHRFPDDNYNYRKQLIYNYCPQYTALNASYDNEQVYYFN
ncbi:gamma-glutamyl hydrolase A-like [Panonychus citri]|uniref:gamma-glutamyl hydrolase A-like n=1 Tax=Panonychus citri TaxID=50023 RepID=UPI00230806A3|nr:gamma-glutamyl hydrolase A-like [Panonychus citri]